MGRSDRRSSRKRATSAAALVPFAVLVLVAGAAPGVHANGAVPASLVPAGFHRVSQHYVDAGVDHWRLRRDDPPQDVHVARMAPALAGRLRVMLAHDEVTGFETTSSMCLRVRCQLAVNGDYSGRDSAGPVGSVVTGGELVRTEGIRMGLFSLDGHGRPAIGHDLAWEVELAVPGEPALAVTAVNRPRRPDSLVLYTPRYGASTGTDGDGTELVLELDGGQWGRVPVEGTTVRLAELRTRGDTPLGPGQVVVSGHGSGADLLEDLWQRTATAPDRSGLLLVSTDGVEELLGGSPTLVLDGRPKFPDNDDDFTRSRHPRTIVGWTATGELLLVTVDGRQPGHSVGMTLREAAELLIGLGAVEAMNLDGGGSSTFVVNSRVVNRPGNPGLAERAVTSALVLLPASGTVGTAAVRATDDSCPPGRIPLSGFGDVGADNPHRAAIDCALARGLTTGTTSGTYSPGHPVDRAQMASFIARMVLRSGGTLPETAPDRYPDDRSSVHQASINRLAAVGIVEGRTDGTYGPHASITRAQMASLLVRAHEHASGVPLAPTVDYFADDANVVHEAAINGLASAGLTGGKRHPHLYAPGELVPRDQMASFLTRTLDLLEDGGAAPAPMP